ncbi:MAG: CDP-alcohol phosphatidyltransferase family protein [Vicinamibacterales bacterium]
MTREPTVWRVPDSPLRGSAFTAKLAGLAAVVALAMAARTVLPLGDRYPLKAAGLFALMMGLSLGFLQQHHPFARFGAANQITTLRAMLVALVAGLVGEPRLPAVASTAVAASIASTLLDGVDGWLARRDHTASPFGARFDMEIDAVLILALSVLAWRHDKAGTWVVVSGLLRYAFVAASTVAPWLREALPPSRRRQAICVAQIVGLTLAMVPSINPPASTLVAAAALAALSYSFLVDIVWLWRRAA